MAKFAHETTLKAFEECNREKDVASFIQLEFNKAHGYEQFACLDFPVSFSIRPLHIFTIENILLCLANRIEGSTKSVWCVAVGRSFGASVRVLQHFRDCISSSTRALKTLRIFLLLRLCQVTHESKRYCHFQIGTLTIVIWKSGA